MNGMRIKGEDTYSALVEWVKNGVKDTSARSYDLAKFLFTVSSSSIGLLAALQKLKEPAALPAIFVLGPHAIFTISLLLALRLILPRESNVAGSDDLHELHKAHIKYMVRETKLWFSVWFVGLAASITTLFIERV